MKYILIVNPAAGDGSSLALINAVADAFSIAGKSDSLIVKYTENKGDPERYSSEYSKQYGGNCMIFACGGDGTVRECASALAYTETPLGVIPMGTGNNFAAKLYGRDCGAYAAAEELGLLSAAPKMHIRRTDIGKCCGEYFVGTFFMGYDTAVESISDKISEKFPRAEGLSHKLGAAAALAGNKKFSVSTDIAVQSTANGKTRKYPFRHKVEYTMLAVSNSGCYRSGSIPSTFSVMNDGLFEMCIAAPCNFAEICALEQMYKRGAADIYKKVKIYTVTGGTFSSADGEPFVINIDGDSRKVYTADFSAEHKALKLCTSIFRV